MVISFANLATEMTAKSPSEQREFKDGVQKSRLAHACMPVSPSAQRVLTFTCRTTKKTTLLSHAFVVGAEEEASYAMDDKRSTMVLPPSGKKCNKIFYRLHFLM